jgi:hypothetical protein
LFSIMQQVQPALSIAPMQSQQPSIIAAHLASPLVQVMHTPSLVISHLHMPIVKLQQQTIMPFIVMHMLHMPPAIMVQRFWTIVRAMASSQEHMTFMPPVHRSILNVQRGTIIQLVVAGMPDGIPIPAAPIPGMPMPVRSIIMALVIDDTPFPVRQLPRASDC